MLLEKLQLQNKRIPFGQNTYVMTPDRQSVEIQVRMPVQQRGLLSGQLRIVIALDIRDERLVKVVADGRTIGVFDIRFAYVNQIFEIPMEAPYSYGSIVLIQEKGSEPTYIFKDGVFGPCFVNSVSSILPVEAFFATLASPLSLQPFGWMEGCVLDGLHSLGNQAAIDEHLSYFINDGKLIYENPRSEISDGTLYGIEGALPFAFIHTPEIVDVFDTFILAFGDDEIISDTDFISAEGCYTIAYPLAKRAVLDGKRNFSHRAIIQLSERQKLLRKDGSLYLRSIDGGLSFKDWGRAYVWYLLGIVQVFRTLGELPNVILDDFRQTCEKVFTLLQEKNDLCFAYMGEPETGIETSTSAGVAAVFHLGYLAGLLPHKYEEKSIRMRNELESHYLTVDGLLCHVGQSNRNGEGFQRSGYRVISQMAMGLFAHCYA